MSLKRVHETCDIFTDYCYVDLVWSLCCALMNPAYTIRFLSLEFKLNIVAAPCIHVPPRTYWVGAFMSLGLAQPSHQRFDIIKAGSPASPSFLMSVYFRPTWHTRNPIKTVHCTLCAQKKLYSVGWSTVYSRPAIRIKTLRNRNGTQLRWYRQPLVLYHFFLSK